MPISVRGSATFRVKSMSCDLPGATATLTEKEPKYRFEWQQVTLEVPAFDKEGPQDFQVILETNDPDQPEVKVPIHFDVRGRIGPSPGAGPPAAGGAPPAAGG
jgi:hypothetical protein